MDLRVNDVSSDLVARLKALAALRKVTMRDYIIAVLTKHTRKQSEAK